MITTGCEIPSLRRKCSFFINRFFEADNNFAISTGRIHWMFGRKGYWSRKIKLLRCIRWTEIKFFKRVLSSFASKAASEKQSCFICYLKDISKNVKRLDLLKRKEKFVVMCPFDDDMMTLSWVVWVWTVRIFV